MKLYQLHNAKFIKVISVEVDTITNDR